MTYLIYSATPDKKDERIKELEEQVKVLALGMRATSDLDETCCFPSSCPESEEAYYQAQVVADEVLNV